MAFEPKAARGQPLQVRKAPANFIDPITPTTPKVMVMFLPGYLVARRFAGQLDQDEPTLGHQSLQGPIDGGDPHRWGIRVGRGEDLLRAQGPVGLLKDLPDDLALVRLAIHTLRNMRTQHDESRLIETAMVHPTGSRYMWYVIMISRYHLSSDIS